MGFSIEEVDGLEGWSGVGVMAMANTRVVRRSAALMEQNQKPYGKTLLGEHRLIRFKEKCKASFLRSSIRLYSLKYTLKYLVRPFLPKPGDGPSQETQDKGLVQSNFCCCFRR